MASQQQSINKTVVTIVVIMITILMLFINKITTPRYLSDIELKINGLQLIKTDKRINIGDAASGGYWLLLANNQEDKTLLDDLHGELKSSIRKQVLVAYHPTESLKEEMGVEGKIIPIIKPSGEFIAYFTPSYDQHKMILTLSSLVTHR